MNIWQGVLLGIVQGLTEFLPVSSSGHLVIMQSLLPGFNQPGVLFDVTLHIATLLAVLIYFRERIFSLTRNYVFLLILATIPAGLAGVLFQDFFESLFSSLWLAGMTLIVTGILNFMTDRFSARRQNMTKVDAFLIGVAQAIAIVPGMPALLPERRVTIALAGSEFPVAQPRRYLREAHGVQSTGYRHPWV